MLDVMGKLFVKVIQGRLQAVVEDVIPLDSQCGFRSGRGSVDMICARQLMEKAREYDTKVYMLFVDLRRPMIRCLARPSG